MIYIYIGLLWTALLSSAGVSSSVLTGASYRYRQLYIYIYI